MALAAALGAPLDYNPPYASALAIELWRRGADHRSAFAEQVLLGLLHSSSLQHRCCFILLLCGIVVASLVFLCLIQSCSLQVKGEEEWGVSITMNGEPLAIPGVKCTRVDGYTSEQDLLLGGRHNEEGLPGCLMNLHELERHTETVVPDLYDDAAWSAECNPGGDVGGAMLADDQSGKVPAHRGGHFNTGRIGAESKFARNLPALATSRKLFAERLLAVPVASATGAMQQPSGEHDGWMLGTLGVGLLLLLYRRRVGRALNFRTRGVSRDRK